jgi:ubiquinone/menaquinone biosynthesis C-methylase UbiE
MNPFDKYSANYTNSSTSQTNAGLQLIELLNPHKAMRILDVGCGDGKITKILASKCFNVIGVDPSTSLLEIAKKKIKVIIYNIFL